MRIGERLKQAHIALGISLSELAAVTGVPYRTIQSYMLLEREPRADILAQICARSRISPAWLLLEELPMLRPAGGISGSVPTVDQPVCPEADSHRRLDALAGILANIDPGSREAILADSFARASTAQRLAELRLAVEKLTAHGGSK